MSFPTKEINLITCILNKWKKDWYCSRNQKGIRYDSGKHKIQTTQIETKNKNEYIESQKCRCCLARMTKRSVVKRILCLCIVILLCIMHTGSLLKSCYITTTQCCSQSLKGKKIHTFVNTIFIKLVQHKLFKVLRLCTVGTANCQKPL